MLIILVRVCVSRRRRINSLSIQRWGSAKSSLSWWRFPNLLRWRSSRPSSGWPRCLGESSFGPCWRASSSSSGQWCCCRLKIGFMTILHKHVCRCRTIVVGDGDGHARNCAQFGSSCWVKELHLKVLVLLRHHVVNNWDFQRSFSLKANKNYYNFSNKINKIFNTVQKFINFTFFLLTTNTATFNSLLCVRKL